MTMEVSSFQSVRSRASAFCVEREWHSFHTPVNLALALSGECGEISEIFQWKGPLNDGVDGFTPEENVHIGEEIADVMLYSTRLCDLCGIDLAYSIRYCAREMSSLPYSAINPSEMFVKECSSSSMNTENVSEDWDNLTFTELDSLVQVGLTKTQSPRALAMSIQSRCGRVCELFLNKTELQSIKGLPDWPRTDVAELALIIGTICLLLSRLARVSNNTLGKCVTDKFLKNEAKYPAEMVKGSSAKYTAYVDSIKLKKKSLNKINESSGKHDGIVLTVFAVVFSIALGYLLGRGGRTLVL